MSTCISQHGEYSEHVPDEEEEFVCGRCFVVDEGAMRAEIQRLRADRPSVTDNARAAWAEAGRRYPNSAALAGVFVKGAEWAQAKEQRQQGDRAAGRAEPPAATVEDVARVLTDIEAAVEDYRTVFPTPEPLSPNLDLAVRAARLIARPIPSRKDLARTILSAIAQHGEITASQIDGINAAAHAVLDLLERADPDRAEANIAAQALEDTWHDLRVIEATGGHIIDPAAWLHERAARIRGGAPAPSVTDDARAEAVRKVLHDGTGGCTCHSSYVARRLEDPGCAWHDIERAIPDVIAAARTEATKVVRR